MLLVKNAVKYLCMLTAFCLSSISFYVYACWSNDWDDIDARIKEKVALPFSASYLLVCLLAIMFFHSSFSLNYYLLKAWKSYYSVGHYRLPQVKPTVIILSTIISSFCGALLFAFAWLYSIQFYLVHRALQFHLLYGTFIVPPVMLGILYFLLKGFRRSYTHRKESQMKGIIKSDRNASFGFAFAIMIVLLCFLYFSVIGFFIDSALLINGQIPDKPRLISHHGYGRKYPENTLMSCTKALENPFSWGIEVDLWFSKDGQLFAHHDETFKRTTNIAKVFPDRVHKEVSSFDYSEILQLEAGSYLSKEFEGEKIPLFSDILRVLANFPDKVIIFDWSKVPDNFDLSIKGKEIDEILRVIDAAVENDGLKHNQVILLNMKMSDEWLQIAGNISKYRFARNAEGKIEDINHYTEKGGSIVNSHFSISNEEIKALQKHDLDINMYTINKKYLFSQMWCLGVSSVTTNELDLFGSMTEPIYFRRSKFLRLCIIFQTIYWVVLIFLLYIFVCTEVSTIDRDDDRLLPTTPTLA